MDSWIYPLLLSLIGGPAAIVFRRWYSKKGDDTTSKFRDAGTYVRDDSLYSYDDKKKDSQEK